MGPVALIILDGFGLAPPGPGNAAHLAETPVFDRLWERYPHTELQASGTAVGLPEGQIGNSEVGHLNLGSGRVVLQNQTYIQSLIDKGRFYENDVLREACEAGSGNALHLMGLVSDGGVHSDLNHFYAILELTQRLNQSPVYIHAFTDGRDVGPSTAEEFMEELNGNIRQMKGRVRFATVSGRYYAMDRDKRWDRTKRAYDAIVCGESEYSTRSALEAVKAAYERDETDEFIKPTVILDQEGQPVGPIREGDHILFFNFRADRARQLSYAITDPDFNEFERCRYVSDLHFASLMEYGDELAAPFAFDLPPIPNCLAEVLSRAGKRQFHAAETEKYPHVTYFFNATREEPFEGEERLLIPSPKVATYDLQPEMSAPELVDKTVERIRTQSDDFILINFANPDMVGHTGVVEAAIAACEATDSGLGRIVDALREKGGRAIVLADHGNCEVMIDKNGGPHTAHTTNPVPCILVDDTYQGRLAGGGKLGDVAPTILELMEVPVPEEMTGISLLDRQ